jgi:mono/diheme cytochrome c family protein
MKRFFRWTGFTLVALISLLLVVYAAVYLLAERELQKVYPTPVATVTVPTDPESIAEGLRLATIHGCANGCHGKSIEGGVMFDQPMIGTLVAPNLTAVVRKYDNAQLAAVIRNGVRPDGHSMMVMPSLALTHLTEADLGRIIAYLRSVPETSGPEASVRLGPLGRLGIVSGKFKTMAKIMSEAATPPPAASPDAELGRYLARSACAECHGADLRGADHGEFVATSLQITNAYSPEAFTTLLRTGVALGGRNVGKMSTFAKSNLSHLSDAEISSLYAYLRALPDAPARD